MKNQRISEEIKKLPQKNKEAKETKRNQMKQNINEHKQ